MKERKDIPQVVYKTFKKKDGTEFTLPVNTYEHSIFKLLDDSFISAYHINDEQYDYICEHATDEELDLLVTDGKTFSQKRQAIQIRDKYITELKNLKPKE